MRYAAAPLRLPIRPNYTCQNAQLTNAGAHCGGGAIRQALIKG